MGQHSSRELVVRRTGALGFGAVLGCLPLHSLEIGTGGDVSVGRPGEAHQWIVLVQLRVVPLWLEGAILLARPLLHYCRGPDSTGKGEATCLLNLGRARFSGLDARRDQPLPLRHLLFAPLDLSFVLAEAVRSGAFVVLTPIDDAVQPFPSGLTLSGLPSVLPSVGHVHSDGVVAPDLGERPEPFVAQVEYRGPVEPEQAMRVTASSALPLEAVPMVHRVELLLEDDLPK